MRTVAGALETNIIRMNHTIIDKKIKSIEYKCKSKRKDARTSVLLVIHSKDACNKKNPIPRPKVTFKRCYDLKDGFTSVSNFYEIGADEVSLIISRISRFPSDFLTNYNPFDSLFGKDYSKIVIRLKGTRSLQITENDLNSDEFKEIKTLLVNLVR